MLHFDVYLSDEEGLFSQLVPIWAPTLEIARTKAIDLERRQRAAAHSLMDIEILGETLAVAASDALTVHSLMVQRGGAKQSSRPVICSL